MSENELTNHQNDDNKQLVVRGQKLASKLNATARNLRFGINNRKTLYSLVGIRPRLRDQIIAFFLIFSFIFLLITPIILGTIYYGFVATDQYESETRFVVRTSVPAISKDQKSGVKKSVDQKIVQDTLVITNYLKSDAILREIEKQYDLNSIFSREDIDFISRLDKADTREEILEYWENMLSATVDGTSGIVVVKLLAFSSTDAQELLKTVIQLAEKRVNGLNNEIWSELTYSAEYNLENSREALNELRTKLRLEQNKSGVFSIDLATESIINIIEKIKLEILELEAQRDVRLKEVAESSNLIKRLDREIEARNKQIIQLSESIASGDQTSKSIATYNAAFESIKLEIKLSEERFAKAIRELERVKLLGSLQLVYIDPFLKPTRAEKSQYPKRVRMIFLVIFLSIISFTIFTSILIIIRNKID